MRLLPLEFPATTGPLTGRIGLGFGCASLGDVQSFTAKCRVVEMAYEAGFRHFDVAPSYGHGEAEAALAAVLGSVRSEVSITSKAGIGHPKAGGALRQLRRLAAPLKSAFPGVWKQAHSRTSTLTAPAGRFGAAQVEASVNESLRRLQRDSLDVLLLHEVTAKDLGAELLDTLARMVADGRVGAVGTGTSVEETSRIAKEFRGRFRVFQVNHHWGARTLILAEPGGALITHRAIRSGLALLDDQAFVRAVSARASGRAILDVLRDRNAAGDLMLVAALRMTTPRMVLVSTSKPERARHFVTLARDSRLEPLADILNDCLDQLARTLQPIAGCAT